LKKSSNFNDAKKLWDKAQATKEIGSKDFEATMKTLPWIILDISIANKEAVYAKMMVKEACTVASNPEDYADAKRLWDKYFDEHNKEVASERTAPAGVRQYTGWRLFQESVSRKDFEYASKLYEWLVDNYTWQRNTRHEAIK